MGKLQIHLRGVIDGKEGRLAEKIGGISCNGEVLRLFFTNAFVKKPSNFAEIVIL